jgi:hypothetical protein
MTVNARRDARRRTYRNGGMAGGAAYGFNLTDSIGGMPAVQRIPCAQPQAGQTGGGDDRVYESSRAGFSIQPFDVPGTYGQVVPYAAGASVSCAKGGSRRRSHSKRSHHKKQKQRKSRRRHRSHRSRR